MAEQWQVGDVVGPHQLDTVTGESVAIPSDRLTHLQFRRFAGCPICTRHVGQLAQRRDEIDAAGITEVVVFHSSVARLREFHDDLPFACVADPDGVLYAEFGVGSSASSLLHPKAWTAFGAGVISSRSLGGSFSSDDHFGLPADLLIDQSGGVVAIKYGRHADDAWSVDELLARAARTA